jgi:serine/threonine-protein kinase
VILYEMLSGALPIDAPSAAEILAHTICQAPTPLRDSAPELPEAVCHLIDACLAKAPADRPASAGRLYEEYHRLASATPGQRAARRSAESIAIRESWVFGGSALPSGAETDPAPRNDHASGSERRRRGGRGRLRRWWPLAIGAGGLVLAGVVLVLAMLGPDRRPPSSPPRAMSPASAPDAGARPSAPPKLSPGVNPGRAPVATRHRVSVRAEPSDVSVLVRLGTAPAVKERAPFTLAVATGQALWLKAFRPGYLAEERRLEIRDAQEVVFRLLPAPRSSPRPLAKRPPPRVEDARRGVGVETLEPML